MNTIEWGKNFPMTEDAAITEDKGILLDFYNPQSIVCRQMDRDTYADNDIIHFISEHLQPFRVDYGEEPYFQHYNIGWMPTLVFLDKYGRENHRCVGYLGPDEFIANGMLALAKIYSSNGNFAAAQYHFDNILKKHRQSCVIEETLFYVGINLYRQTKNPEELKKTAEFLKKDFPGGCWTKRAAPYRKITEQQTA